MIHLEPGHRIVAETIAARIHSPAEKREAVDVRCSDFGAQYYVSVSPEQKNIMRVSLWLHCYDEVKDLVGERFFQEMYPGLEAPQQGYSLTLAVDLDMLPPDTAARGVHGPPPAPPLARAPHSGGAASRGVAVADPTSPPAADAIVRKLASMKRDVLGAPLWVCFKALLEGSHPPRQHYVVHYRPEETMYIIPAKDLVVVVFSLCFENQVEQAIARVFLQARPLSRTRVAAPLCRRAWASPARRRSRSRGGSRAIWRRRPRSSTRRSRPTSSSSSRASTRRRANTSSAL